MQAGQGEVRDDTRVKNMLLDTANITSAGNINADGRQKPNHDAERDGVQECLVNRDIDRREKHIQEGGNYDN